MMVMVMVMVMMVMILFGVSTSPLRRAALTPTQDPCANKLPAVENVQRDSTPAQDRGVKELAAAAAKDVPGLPASVRPPKDCSRTDNVVADRCISVMFFLVPSFTPILANFLRRRDESRRFAMPE